VLFRETNPTPLKYALSLLGLMSAAVRLPLVAPSENVRAEIAGVLGRIAFKHADAVIGAIATPNGRARSAAVA